MDFGEDDESMENNEFVSVMDDSSLITEGEDSNTIMDSHASNVSTGNIFRQRLERLTMAESLENNTIENAELFNTVLATEHSYLGNLKQVSESINLLDEGVRYKLPVRPNRCIAFPGDTIPMLDSFYDSEGKEINHFGLVFVPSSDILMERNPKQKWYGVTCQVYEKSNDASEGFLKCRAYQRFQLSLAENPTFLQCVVRHYSVNRVFEAWIKILPEIILPDPLFGPYGANLVNKFKHNSPVYKKLRRYHSQCSPWPNFVYDQYDTQKIIDDVKALNSKPNVELVLPTEPVALSFWCARNLPLNESEVRQLFESNLVQERLIIIKSSLKYNKCLRCKICHEKIADFNQLFSMSKDGVQPIFCNPSGFIHETKTVHDMLPNSVVVENESSDEFSWFPGYAWQLTYCKTCNAHVGWKFTSGASNLIPRSFFGLSGVNVFDIRV